MADIQILVIAPGGDTIRTGFQKLDDNAQQQLRMWLSATPPTTPGDGDTWGDDSDSANYVYYTREDGTNKLLLWFHRMEEDLDGNGHEFKGLIPERVATGSIVAPSVADEGTIQYDSTRKRLVFVTDTETYEVRAEKQDGAFAEIDTFFATATLANAAEPSTATAREGYLLESGKNNITINAARQIPEGYADVPSASQKIILRLFFLLNATATANDKIGVSGTLYADEPLSAIGGKTASIPTDLYDIGAGTAQYALHVVDRVFSPGDFSADPVPGELLRAAVTLDTGQSVAEAILIAATFKVSSYTAMVEQ